jgi:hypothetical protein
MPGRRTSSGCERGRRERQGGGGGGGGGGGANGGWAVSERKKKMKETISLVKKELEEMFLEVPKTENELNESLEKIAKRLVGKIKLCLQNYNNEDYNVNVTTTNDPYQGIVLDVNLEEVGRFNKTNIFKISYHKYNGLDFTWKFINGYSQTDKNILLLNVLTFLTTSKFFQHLLETLEKDLNDVFDKRLSVRNNIESAYNYRRNAVDQLHSDFFLYLVNGSTYQPDKIVFPNWGLVDYPFTSIKFVRNPKKRSGKLFVQPSEGELIEYENVTFHRLDNIARAIITYEIY